MLRETYEADFAGLVSFDDFLWGVYQVRGLGGGWLEVGPSRCVFRVCVVVVSAQAVNLQFCTLVNLQLCILVNLRLCIIVNLQLCVLVNLRLCILLVNLRLCILVNLQLCILVHLDSLLRLLPGREPHIDGEQYAEL